MKRLQPKKTVGVVRPLEHGIQVLAARARFSLRIDAFNATINPDSLTGSRFVAWLGQVQWARQLTAWGLRVIARSEAQLSPQPLLSLEQIAVEGALRYEATGRTRWFVTTPSSPP
jgi:hemolysin activation/secretion protein